MNQEWKNISDDDLDRLFREAADEKNVGFEADSWQKMSQSLDTLPKTEEKETYWKRAILLLLLLLLGSVGGYFLLKPNGETTKIVENNAIENTISDEKTKLKTDAKSVQNNAKENENLKVLEENRKTISAEKEKAILKEKIIVNNSISDSYENDKSKKDNNLKSEAREIEEKNIAYSKKSNETKSNNFTEKSIKKPRQRNEKVLVGNGGSSKTNNFSENENIEKTDISVKEKSIPENSNQNTENQTVIHNSTTLSTNISETENLKKWELWGVNENLKNKNVNFRTDWNLPKIEFQTLLPTKIQTNPQGIPFKRGFNLRLNFSPDLSTVSFNKIAKIGINYGGMIEYRFNKRWSLQTGLLRSTKIYDAYPEQYTWIWKKPYTPLTEINATCKMLDVPINLRFDLTQKTKNRWFVSAGATTYHMLNETYIYNYENNDDPSIKVRKWIGSTGTYGLKVLNFSTGYEWQVKRKMTLQFEPFAKIPTQKIGFGKVNLMTFGVFFSGKYHFGK